MTDIEGSTRLVRELGPAFPALLSEHFDILGRAVTDHGGTLVSSEGDSVFAVFPSVRQAVQAAVEGQGALASHEWPADAHVRVRMGIHAGEAVFGGRDYTGIDVHRTARIMAAGHGGEVLLSETARALATDDPAFRDLGSHQLRDMPEPEHLFQLLVPGLPSDFPPLRTVPTTVPTNLPTPLTRFVGRSAELAAAGALLADSRLLTLTGPGGTGKTRLSIELGRDHLHAFPGGVWFVQLDVVRDPALVLPAVARTIGVADAPGQPFVAAIAHQVAAGGPVLVIMDNVEQVVAAAPDIAALLAVTSDLTILATSREPLAIAGERLFTVPPLALPAEPGHPSAAALAGNDCVALFVERARAARADFVLTDANAAAVAAICRRLDGLPLALELAAARVNLLAPEQILARMDHRLGLLASSRRDLTDRQRTLRGAIDWSYDLLSEPERAFFRRFAVFSGGADLDAVQAVIDPSFELGDGLDLASALIDRSLLRSTTAGAENRLDMLETLREYAAERLAESPTEARATGLRHAGFFADLAVSYANVLTDPHRDELLDRLDRELPNFRAAIAFAIANDDVDDGARIVVGLRTFWHGRGHLADGARLLAQMVDATADRPFDTERIELVSVAAEISAWNGSYEAARRYAEQILGLAKATGDANLLARAHTSLAWATIESDPPFARDEFREGVRRARAIDDLELLSGSLGGLGTVLTRLGEWDEALVVLNETIEVYDRRNDPYTNLYNYVARGFVECRLGRIAEGRSDYRHALLAARRASAGVGIALAIEAIAVSLLEAGDAVLGATLSAGAGRLREEAGGGPTVELAGATSPLVTAEAALPAEEFSAATAAGRAMPTDELIERALAATQAG
jgi:predicted ATPase